MDPPTRAQDTPKLRQQPPWIGYQLGHVTAHEQIDARRIERQIESIALLEPNFRTPCGGSFSETSLRHAQ